MTARRRRATAPVREAALLREPPAPAGEAGPSRAIAAVDLGSNSFHMVVADVEDGHVRVVDRLRERTALAEGLGPDGRLDAAAQERALHCLARFGQRLRDLPPAAVRAVGTHALRRAKDVRPFLERAQRALGHAIEVIPGPEEARLIYLGVAQTVGDAPGRRLVVDIGGGSTECIVGEGFEALRTDSLDMGCVSFGTRFFPDGRISRKAMTRARLAAKLELRPIRRLYRRLRWDGCIGSSGTILAVEQVLAASGEHRPGIAPAGVARLVEQVVAAGRVSRLRLPGLAPDRAPVFPGGVAILSAVVESLGVRRMSVSTGALREGVLFDLLGRMRHEDVRDRTIRRLAARHHVDSAQARRVERTALRLLAEAARAWGLAGEDARQTLSWVARLHEIGLAVAYSGHHKHGAYLVGNSAMAGFSRDAQAELAAILLGHRRRLRPEAFASLPPHRVERALRLCVLLRLAVLLNRSRTPRPLPPLSLSVSGGRVRVGFPPRWLARHPLTRTDLDEERRLLKGAVTLSCD